MMMASTPSLNASRRFFPISDLPSGRQDQILKYQRGRGPGDQGGLTGVGNGRFWEIQGPQSGVRAVTLGRSNVRIPAAATSGSLQSAIQTTRPTGRCNGYTCRSSAIGVP
jgi:hypothetical protein